MCAGRAGARIRVLACGVLAGFIACAGGPDDEIEACLDHSAFEAARAKPYPKRLTRCNALVQLSPNLCSVCDQANALGDSSCLALNELANPRSVTFNGMTATVVHSTDWSEIASKLNQARRTAENACAETTEPDWIEVSPLHVELVDGQELELAVTAHFGGFTRDFSASYRGTRYESLLPSIARVNNWGIVTGGEQDGKTVVTVRRGAFEEQVEVRTRLPEPNTPPFVPELAPMVVGAGNEISVDASECYDPDGHPIRFHWAQLSGPSVGVFRSDAQMLVFEAPQATAAIELALTVTDYRGDATTRETVINVFKNNSRPEPQILENQTVRPGAVVTLDASGSTDADGDKLSYAWYQMDGPRVKLRAADTPRVEFTAPDPGATPIVLRFGFIVDDGTDESYPGYATVTIQP